MRARNAWKSRGKRAGGARGWEGGVDARAGAKEEERWGDVGGHPPCPTAGVVAECSKRPRLPALRSAASPAVTSPARSADVPLTSGGGGGGGARGAGGSAGAPAGRRQGGGNRARVEGRCGGARGCLDWAKAREAHHLAPRSGPPTCLQDAGRGEEAASCPVLPCSDLLCPALPPKQKRPPLVRVRGVEATVARGRERSAKRAVTRCRSRPGSGPRSLCGSRA